MGWVSLLVAPAPKFLVVSWTAKPEVISGQSRILHVLHFFQRGNLHTSTAPLSMRYTTMRYTSMRYTSMPLYFYK